MSTDLQTASPACQVPPPTNQSTKPSKALKWGFRWFLVGFGLIGISAGFFAGTSVTPVIGTLLPLVFGLLGGSGGFYLAGANLASTETALRLRLLGIALTTFAVLLIAGSVYGVMLRTGLSLKSFVPRSLIVPDEGADLGLDGLSSPKALQLMLTRARLKALGASDAEQAAILHNLICDQTSHASLSHAEVLLRLAAQMDRVALALFVESQKENTAEEKKDPQELFSLSGQLKTYSRDYQEMASQIKDEKQISASLLAYHFKRAMEHLDWHLSKSRRWAEVNTGKKYEFRQLMYELHLALFEESRRLEAEAAVDRPELIQNVNQEIDKFLATINGARARTEEAPLVDKPRLAPHFAP